MEAHVYQISFVFLYLLKAKTSPRETFCIAKEVAKDIARNRNNNTRNYYIFLEERIRDLKTFKTLTVQT